MSPPRPWTVTRHDAIVEHEPNLWSVSGDIPGLKGMNRRMSIAKLQDGRLVFFNAVPLDDLSMHRVTSWGTPWLLITPHRAHTMDAHAFSTRLKLTTAAPDIELEKVRKRVPDVVGLSTITGDASLTIGQWGGSKLNEPWLISRSAGGASLIVSDVIQNSYPKSLLLKLLGFGGGAKVTPAQKLLFVSDKAEVKRSVLALAAEPGLRRLVPSHGEVLEQDVPGTLNRIAQTL
jgi:hypothetical protein